jgi:hypothetical protein
MRPLLAALLGALAAAGALAVVTLASGGPPPEPDAPPAVQTVVARGTGSSKVARPAKLNNRTIERAARRARAAALPKAVAAARKEAKRLAKAAGLRLSGPIGIARDAAPFGYFDYQSGRFGPGDWCGRWVSRRNGTRVARHRCFPPRDQQIGVSMTFATG